MAKQLLRKISPRTVFGTKTDILELVLANKTKPQGLFNVFGIATGIRKGTSIIGDEENEWTALLGQFEAHNLKTGEVFQSGVCFLPGYITDIVAGKLTPEVQSVRFAFRIDANYDEASATTYNYSGSPLIETNEADPLAELISAVPPPVAQITAAKK